MTACTQPRCTGTIVDSYCDVCGSPAVAAPFVPTAPAASAKLSTDCTQPRCPGTIVDGYCNVCGSAARAVPFISTAAAASAASSISANGPGLTAVPAPPPAFGPADQEIPTERIPRGKTPRQQLSTQEMTDPRAVAPGAVKAQNAVGEKEVADDWPDGAEGYRRRVEEAQLPDEVRKAALSEVEELERTGDQNPESGDIRTWLDTILDLPWSTKAADWIDIHGSPEVEATLRRLIEPIDDIEDSNAAEAGPVAADVEEGDAAAPVDAGIPTLFDLRWSPETTDSIDIQGSREVEATLRRLIEPAAADLEQGHTAGAEPAAADIEQGHTAGAEPAAADIEQGHTAGAEPAAADIEQGHTAEVEPAAADIEQGHTAEVERAAADIEQGHTAGAEPAAADIEQGHTAGAEPAAADIEQGDTAEVEPAVADMEEGDTAEVEPAVADMEEGDTAPAGPQHDDKVKMPAVPAVSSGGRQQRPQLPKQQVLGPEPVQTPAEKRRFGSLALAATALAALLIGALLFAATRDRDVTARSVPTVMATATATVSKPTNAPSNQSTDTGGEESTIQLEDLPESAGPFETVRVQGTYRGGADTFLRVQRWEGGRWLAFPLPTKTDQSGRFTAYVELGQPGRYRLRVLDPESGMASKPFVLVIKG
jgi:hypothetical protein